MRSMREAHCGHGVVFAHALHVGWRRKFFSRRPYYHLNSPLPLASSLLDSLISVTFGKNRYLCVSLREVSWRRPEFVQIFAQRVCCALCCDREGKLGEISSRRFAHHVYVLGEKLEN